MRLLGNKTKLLDHIEDWLSWRGVESGTFLDVFAGTGSVASHFRRKGFHVYSNDFMRSSYVMQRVLIGLESIPEKTADLLEKMAAVEPRYGLISRQFSEGSGRLFFSEENGQKIDGVHHQLVSWLVAGEIDEDQFYVLLLILLEASDRVANISGTYGAFLKKLSRAAAQPMQLRPLAVDLSGPVGEAFCRDANELVKELEVDVLYLDPPYNGRQYVKYYHVREILSELHTVKDPEVYESRIYGKTGLLSFDDRMSAYCRSSQDQCLVAFRDLVRSARAKHIVLSYNEEGILSKEEIGACLAEASGKAFNFEENFREISYKRFRSDSDDRRAYKVLEDREKDEVWEWLFYAAKA